MKDFKAIVNDLTTQETVTLSKKNVIENVYVSLEEQDNGIQLVVLRMGSKIPTMEEKTVTDKEGETSKQWVKGEGNTVFTSIGEIITCLKQDVELVFLASLIKADDTLLPELLTGATVNVLCEEVKKDSLYKNPFSDKTDPSYKVPRDSVYTTLYGLQLGSHGEEFANELKIIDREIKKERLKEALAKGKTPRIKRSKSAEDDNEDD